MFAAGDKGERLPINYRLYDPTDGKTKNDYFREMMDEILAWGARPVLVTGDAWYSSLGNMKYLRDKGIHWLFAVKGNRTVSETAHDRRQIKDIKLDEQGKNLYLKGYGQVKVFRKDFKNDGPKYYATSLADMSSEEFLSFHAKHWTIEEFHRAIKQVCNAEKSMVRSTQGVRNHFYCVLRAFSFLEWKVLRNKMNNWYRTKRELYNEVVKKFILEHVDDFVTA